MTLRAPLQREAGVDGLGKTPELCIVVGVNGAGTALRAVTASGALWPHDDRGELR